MSGKAKDKVTLIENKKTNNKVATKKVASNRNKTNSKDVPKTKNIKTSNNKKITKNEKTEFAEYYDLPIRYNQTIIRILAQTPTKLFVYWDISNEDKENYIKEYGQYFFNDTKPILVVHNITMNYSFEIEINDYANSWYIDVEDSNCEYNIQLGRRPINKYARIEDFLPVSSSNNLEIPNNHILLDSLNNNIYFRNIKTNVTTKKNISISSLTKIGKVYNMQDFYKNLYKDENINFNKLDFKNICSS